MAGWPSGSLQGVAARAQAGQACLSRPGELRSGSVQSLFARETVEPPGKELVLEEEGTAHKQRPGNQALIAAGQEKF